MLALNIKLTLLSCIILDYNIIINKVIELISFKKLNYISLNTIFIASLLVSSFSLVLKKL